MTGCRNLAVGLAFCTPLIRSSLLVLACASAASARTILLTDEDCQKMAAICADAPRMSWAGMALGVAEFSNHQVDVGPKQSFLMGYPLDRVPQGQRITKAEWIVPVVQAYPAAGVRMRVYRLLRDWGPGVSYQLRMIRPERTAWQTPGARGLGQDRAAKATASAIARSTGELTFNVTQDVELWHSGAASNYGWILTVEDADVFVRLHSPYWGAPKGWKLRITFEPE